MRIGYDKYYYPIELDISTFCHMLIVGGSGSGKTQAWWYMLGKLLKDDPTVRVTVCDFKKEFDILNNHTCYYGGEFAYNGILNYYEKFCDARDKAVDYCKNILIVEEYPSLISFLSTKDKINKTRKSNEIMNAVAEILMMGRSLQFGIWVIMQRADASFFNNGARDNFMVIIGLGTLSSVQLQMLFSGEEIPDKHFSSGQGIMLADGFPIQEIVIPKIKNITEWNRHIYAILQK